MKQCTVCGTLSRDDTVYCYICGSKFSRINADVELSQGDNCKSFAAVEQQQPVTTIEKSRETSQDNIFLRYDGLYSNDEGTYSYYLRFYPDGIVIGVSSTGTGEQVGRWIGKRRKDLSSGRYQIKNNMIEFTLGSKEGSVVYQGEMITDKSMILDSHSYINGHKSFKRNFVFTQVNLKAD